MRRGFSILLILLFSLGPAAAAVTADDSRLPACCRRNGAHHCAMDDAAIAILAQAAGAGAGLGAPAHCPFFPRILAPLVQWPAALVVDAAPARSASKPVDKAAHSHAAPSSSSIRTQDGRGPPTADLA